MDRRQLKTWFKEFMNKHKINQVQMAEKLGVANSHCLVV